MATKDTSTESHSDTSSASGHSDVGQDAHRVHAGDMDVRGARVDDFVKDVGVDELQMMAGSNRADQWQYASFKNAMDQAAVTTAQAWQAFRHVEADENQRMRHADTMQALTAMGIGETLEAISSAEGRICAHINKMAGK